MGTADFRQGEGSRPSWHRSPKLTPKQRDEIRKRRADGESVKELASEYGVSVKTLYSNS